MFRRTSLVTRKHDGAEASLGVILWHLFAPVISHLLRGPASPSVGLKEFLASRRDCCPV